MPCMVSLHSLVTVRNTIVIVAVGNVCVGHLSSGFKYLCLLPAAEVQDTTEMARPCCGSGSALLPSALIPKSVCFSSAFFWP